MTPRTSIQKITLATPLASSFEDHTEPLMTGTRAGLEKNWTLVDGTEVAVGKLADDLPPLPPAFASWESPTNRLLEALLYDMWNEIEALLRSHGPFRLGVVIGTSTSGVARNEPAYATLKQTGTWPDDYVYARQELGDPALFVAARTGITGPRYVISTACSSGAKALISAARLIAGGICDAVICGGADTVCGLTVNGFAALEAISKTPCNPFSRNRDGITIGEGGALFLMTRDAGPLFLAGWGENCDAYHFSAPDPEGKGAALSIQSALAHADIEPCELGYINLHGTGTKLNDQMEAKVMHRLFGGAVPVSSTKGMTGHMLGSAGSCEAAFVALALLNSRLPPHLWDGDADPELPKLPLVQPGDESRASMMMSCSYAFGGNNCTLIMGKA